MLINKLKQKLSGEFIRNVGWLGGAELANRVFRLGTTVVLARLLSPHDYGLAAVVITTNEFAHVFTLRAGIGGKVIQSSEEDVEVLSNTAYWLNWILCGSLFIIQCAAAYPIALFYGDNRVIFPICVAALVYLMLPIYAIQNARITRENRLDVTAIGNVLQSFFGNIFTVILAFLGLGMWAIVLPIVLTCPIWIVVNYSNHSWRPTKSFTLYRWQEIVDFGKDVLGYQLLDKLRSNLDYLLIGGFLGVDVLGFYYFAFNAGLGISLNIINVLVWPLFPHLCAARGDLKQLKQKYFSSLKTIASVIVPLVLLQSSLAPFYVPIIFGEQWVEAIPILILICLSALPRPFASAAAMLLQSVDKSRLNLYWSFIFTGFFAAALVVAMQWGTLAVAAAVLISHISAMPLFAVWATKYVFGKKSPLSFEGAKV
jgi:O-antigen/teichoic acid export membrane protein